ncbi:hypothetical protein WDU94_008048 [Cyamophila willieti]
MAPNAEGKRPESLPVGADCTLSPLPASTPNNHRVVCSPDLPVLCIAPALADEGAVDSSTAPAEKFQCQVCNKTFTHKNTFQNHLKTHKEGEDPYQCNFCGKTFAVPARLTRHYRTHTGEKPYQCEYCNKSFSVKENLSVHRRIHTKRTHTGEKPYVCRSCGKGFTCSKQLKVHTRTHTGEKPYSCDICGKSFGYNHVLKLHQVAHYGEKVYKCTICNETFTSKKSMENHIKTHSEPPASRPEGDFSCGSTTSDKENKGEEIESRSPKPTPPPPPSPSPTPMETDPLPSMTPPNREIVQHANRNLREIWQYLNPMIPSTSHHARSPALLALATAAEAEDARRQYYSPPLREDSPTRSHSSYGSPESPLTPVLPVTEPNVYLIPDSMASITRRNFTTPPPELSSGMSSPTNSASPVPEADPGPMVLTVGREVLILPPRKRCKMILKSMEELTEGAATVRYSSVIQYAGVGLTEQ